VSVCVCERDRNILFVCVYEGDRNTVCMCVYEGDRNTRNFSELLEGATGPVKRHA
jgi:hypothetical protein